MDFGNFSWENGNVDDVLAKEALRSFMLISPGPSIYDLPSNELVAEWKEETFRLFGYPYALHEQVYLLFE